MASAIVGQQPRWHYRRADRASTIPFIVSWSQEMSSTVRIDGSLPDPGDNSTKGLVFSGRWAVQYDWSADRASATGQPQRLSSLSFPAAFNETIAGALRGRAAFSAFLYIFKDGQYMRLQQPSMIVDGPPAGTQTGWGLPGGWTSYDAVLPGRGKKIGFCYFVKGPQYVRFDWAANQVSPGYPRFVSAEWHTTPPFTDGFDGVIAGQGAYSTKAYVFKTIKSTVAQDGSLVPVGSPGWVVEAPAYIRYDFDAETAQGAVTDPFDVVTQWPGLFPLLDAGQAIDIALNWCDAAIAAIATPTAAGVQTALAHHFMAATPTHPQVQTIANTFAAVRNRLTAMPNDFRWNPSITVPAQTFQQQLTEISNDFSHKLGPNGRAAVLIHEAVHFVTPPNISLNDVPEWCGETIQGMFRPVPPKIGIAYHDLTTAQASVNPSSYAAFAQEVFFGNDTRFGQARLHE